MQSIAVLVTAVLFLVVASAFTWVLTNTKGTLAPEQFVSKAYRLRYWFFIVVMVVGVVIAFVTLNPWPHAALEGAVNRQVQAKSQQWLWELSTDKAQVGEVVEFVVTSADVNHGFGLYDPQRRLVAQVQAMPGFVNKVRYRFTEPGKYQVLCMEYCGLLHHGMAAEINVQPAVAQ